MVQSPWLQGQSFTIGLFKSANGQAEGDSVGTLEVTQQGIKFTSAGSISQETTVELSDGTSDGSHNVDFGNLLQTTSDFPFLIAKIDPNNDLHLDDTSHLRAATEGIAFDGVTVWVSGTSTSDVVSQSSFEETDTEVPHGYSRVDINEGTSYAFSLGILNASDVQFGFQDIVVQTYGGDDNIQAFAPGDVTIRAGSGNDVLWATDLYAQGSETPTEPTHVYLYGDDGDDILLADGMDYSGVGLSGVTAYAYGGMGNDIYRYLEPDSGDAGHVTVFENEGEGQDEIDLSFINRATVIDLSSGLEQNVTSGLSLTLDTPNALEDVNGTAYDDQLTGNDQDNIIQGGAGNDMIFATAGKDQLYGGSISAASYGTGDDTFVFSDLVDATAADQIFAGYDGTQLLDFGSMSSRALSLDPTLQGVWQSGDGELDLNLNGNFTVNLPTGGKTPTVADTGTTSPQTISVDDNDVVWIDGTIGQVTINLNTDQTQAVLQLGTITQPVVINMGGQQLQIDAATGQSTLKLSIDDSRLHIERFNTFGTAGASTISAHLVGGAANKINWSNDSGDATFTTPNATTLLPSFTVWSGTLTFSADQHASSVALDGADAHLLFSGTQHIDSLETDDGATATITGGTLTVANADRSSLNFEVDLNTAAVVVTSPDGAVWTASNSGTDASHFGFSAFTDGEGNVYDVNITKRGVGNLVEGASGRIANTDTTIARYTTLIVADTDGTHPASGDITLAGDAQTTLDLSGLAAQANVNLNTTGSFQNIIADASLRIKLTGVPGNVVGSMGGGTLTGDGGANHLVATGGTTSLIGGAGNDTLTFMGGDATIDPGSGADTIEVVDPLEGNVWGFVDVYASSGDTLDLSGMSALADVDLAETTVEQTIAANPDDGSQVLTLRLHASPSKLIGSAGGGSLIGTSGNDTLVATGGTTAIDGGNGNDTFIVNGGVANINVVSVAGDTKTILPDVNNSVTHVTSANNSVYIDLKAAGQELVMFRVYGDGNIALTASGDANGRLVVTSTGTAVMYNYYLMAAAGGFDWINRSGGLIYLDAVTSTTIKPNFEISGGSVSFLSPTTVGNIVTDGGGAYIQTTLHANSISVQSGVVYNGSLLLTTHDLHIGQGLFFTGAHGSEGARALVVDHLSMDRDSAGHYIGKLDINNNVLIWHGGGADGMISVVDMLTHNSLFSTWLGHGLGGASTNYTGLGVMQNNNLAFSSTTGMVTSGGTAFYTTFAGQSVGVNDVLVKYTWLGDCDLDGVITAGDYSLIDAAFLRQNTVGPIGGWVNGDFDLDGRITAGDYAQIDLSYPHQTGVL